MGYSTFRYLGLVRDGWVGGFCVLSLLGWVGLNCCEKERGGTVF
jgi:hypothetical protein